MANILFPTDFSDTANNAFLYAVNLAKVLNADVKLISVSSHLNHQANIHQEDFESYTDQLKSLATANNLGDVNVKSSLEVGDLLLTIMDFVSKEDVKYIVMGTNGQNSLGKKIFGSNTLNVINNATVPVLVIPNRVKFKAERNFGYATLFNEKENKALAQMIEVTDRYKKELKIVHVENNVMTQEMVHTKKEWESTYPKVSISVENNEDVEEGLINFCTSNKIDVLGVVHRELSAFDRLFTVNHSNRLLQTGNVALLIFQESN